MKSLRQLETSTKLFACIALVLCVGVAVCAWLIGHLAQMNELSARASGQANGAAAALARAEFGLARSWSLGFLVLEFGVAVMLCIWLAREVARPVRAAVAVARRVAEGDLSHQNGGRAGGASGRLLRAMQDMKDKLIGMIVEMRSGTESIASDAGDLCTASLDLSARTRRQAAALDASAASMHQLAAKVNDHAEHARQASQLALAGAALALKGGAAVSELAATMASVDAAAQQIARIVDVFDAVTFQSRLLMLNAAVDTARLGEQGGAFALVASEVYDLTQRSALAAKDLKALIDDARAQLGAGALLADQAGTTLTGVVSSVQRVSEIVGALACASVEQGGGIAQLKLEVAAIGKASWHNASLVGEAAAAAAAMRAQADRLNRVIGSVVLDAEHSRPPHQIHLIASNLAKPAGVKAEGVIRAAPMVRAVGAPLAAQHVNGAKTNVDGEQG